MTDKPRRFWFQLHLSTAIVLMFVAGGFLWANVREYQLTEEITLGFRESKNVLYWSTRGWPFPYSRTMPDWDITVERRIVSWNNAMMNLLMARASVVVCVYACEFFIRRREARAP